MKMPTRLSLTPLSVAAAAALGSAFVLAAEVAAPVLGETITVTGSNDAAPTACTGTGSAVTCANLRSAIVHANANNDGLATYDVIVLANGSVHTLSVVGKGEGAGATGDLDILGHVNIQTAAATGAKATIQGGEGFGDRLLDINSPDGVAPATAVIVKLDNLVLTKGQGVYMNGGAIYANDGANLTVSRSLITDNFASWDQVDGTGELQGSGGGIYSKGILTVSQSTLSKNTAKTLRGEGTAEGDKIGNGGAIYASQATTIVDSTIGGVEAGNVAINGGGVQMAGGNKLEVLRSTFSHNDAISGGGINVVSPSASPFTVTNSTFSTNHVTDSGAAINTNSSVTILNTTIANNVKDSGNKGAGLNLVGGTATLKNTLLAYNTGGGASANCGRVGSGTLSVFSGGGNLSTDATCNLTLASDQQGIADAKIGPLALNDNTLNGTFTHALLDGSPAIDRAINEGAPSSDQRGIVRPFDYNTLGVKVADVGAYEVFIARSDLSIPRITVLPTERVVVGSDATVRVEVLNANDSAPAVATKLTTDVPSGLQFKSSTVEGIPGGCTSLGTTVECVLGDLPANATRTIEMVMTVNAAGTNTVTSTVTTTTTDPYPENNRVTASVVGLTRADLNLTATSQTVDLNGQAVVGFTVLNQGAGDARNIVLSGTVPDGVTLAGVSDTGTCTVSGQAFTCNIPELAANASRSVDLTVTAGTSEGAYPIVATVTGDVIDDDAADNTATATVTVKEDDDGGGGGGCTTNPNARFDLGLLGMLAAALAGLGLRRRRRA